MSIFGPPFEIKAGMSFVYINLASAYGTDRDLLSPLELQGPKTRRWRSRALYRLIRRRRGLSLAPSGLKGSARYGLKPALFALLLLLGALTPWSAWASTGGGIEGTVIDASGAVIPNTAVAARNLDTGARQAVNTNMATLQVIQNLGSETPRVAGDNPVRFFAGSAEMQSGGVA